MFIDIRRFKDRDYSDLVRCMEELQDYLVSIDPMCRMRRLSGYGDSYTLRLLEKVAKNEGRIYLAFDQSDVIGCSAGIIERQSADDILDNYPSVSGRVLELYVNQRFRGNGIGRELMDRLEDHFRSRKCDVVRLEVFSPNVSARGFYEGLGFTERMVDVLRRLK